MSEQMSEQQTALSPDLHVGIRVTTENEAGRPFFYPHITSQFRFLEGKVLTVVDAAFNDHEQRKAVKDLIRGQFRDQLKHIENCCFGRLAEGSSEANERQAPGK